MDEFVLVCPDVLMWHVVGSVAKTSRAMHLAEGVCRSSQAVLSAQSGPVLAKGHALMVTGPGVSQSADHADKGEGGEDGEEDVVQDDKGLERTRLGDGPGLVAAVSVDLVHDDGGGSIQGANGNGHLPVERVVVELGVNCKGTGKGTRIGGRGQRERGRIRRELEEPGGRRPQVERGPHDGRGAVNDDC